MNLHPDVLDTVVGGAGMYAVIAAARAGAVVLLVDELYRCTRGRRFSTKLHA